MQCSRQEYWNGFPFPSPRDLPDPKIERTSLMSPALADALPLEPKKWICKVKLFSRRFPGDKSMDPDSTNLLYVHICTFIDYELIYECLLLCLWDHKASLLRTSMLSYSILCSPGSRHRAQYLVDVQELCRINERWSALLISAHIIQQ